ncbi:hypothetical protein [Bailinhaonella thermotolerans]|uniref:Histidine phosphatase family protein n=1 Tax=Bailinhaonella thermotolerans TaxID=1070861 RepID=A0A3A4B8K1_9ACTN|nr:hypothetical protein [Bailinhaonella thermotolerans]RJL34551.1 hypothetical protein D5H75_09100 [Bailinhaonella thermotolerans]
MSPRGGRTLAALAACAAVLTALAGCGIRPTGTVRADEAPRARGPVATNTLYFLRHGELAETTRRGLPGLGMQEHAIAQLLVGPTQAERRSGMTTEVPPLGRHMMVQAAMRIVVPAGTRLTPMARAQIVCTAFAQKVPRVEFVHPEEGAAIGEYGLPVGKTRAYTCESRRAVPVRLNPKAG